MYEFQSQQSLNRECKHFWLTCTRYSILSRTSNHDCYFTVECWLKVTDYEILFQKYHTDIKDLEHLGELGNGTCGHVVKMLHKPSNTVIAVKVSGEN